MHFFRFMTHRFIRDSLSLFAALLLAAPLCGAERKAAIFVENRAGEKFAGKEAMLEDLLASKVSAQGFRVLSKGDTVEALNKSGGKNELDHALSEQSSALRLAQALNCDFVFLASINSYGFERKTFKDENINTDNETHTLRLAYRLLEAGEGAALTGDAVSVSRTIRFTGNASNVSTDLLNALLEEASVKLTDAFTARKAAVKDAVAKLPGKVNVSFAAVMTDSAGSPVTVPDLRVAEDGVTLVKGTNALPVELIDVTIEVNGLTVGSAPGAFPVSPGINKVRLTREGFKTLERTFNFVEGQKFRVAMQMSDEGYRRWKDNTNFLQKLREREKLTDADVDLIKSSAQMLRQSGYKVDINQKVEGKSLYDGATVNILNKSVVK